MAAVPPMGQQQGVMQPSPGFGGQSGGGFGGGMGAAQQQGFNQGGYGGQARGGNYGGGGGPMMQGAGGAMGMNPHMQGGAVAMVYGIDHENWNCDKIFNILCLYGNVMRIKLMRTKTDTAMVEFGSPDQMQCACKNLQNVDIFQGSLILRPSKQTTVEGRGPFSLPDGTDSFKDYSNSRNNRFATEEAARKNRIVPPGKILHWYNAPTNMDEDKMKQVFAEADAPVPKTVTVFQTRSDRSSTGTLEFGSVREACEALVKAQHSGIPSPTGKIPYVLKLCFASTGERRERF